MKPSAYLNPDGTFKGGFDGCVAHMQEAEGHNLESAQKICGYIAQQKNAGAGSPLPAPGSAIVHALAADLPSIALTGPEGKELPAQIQYMPPGAQTITVNGADGERLTHQVTVNARTAEVLQSQLQAFRQAAAKGIEDKPYFDFNHEDAAAAGHVTEFYWGGDDPVTGGVRAKVEWTEPGRQALLGKAYRRFSPSFYVNANGEVTGAPLNMGGLVNRAAFKTIAPIVAGGACTQLEGPTSKHPNTMDPKEKELADLKTAVSAKDTEITQLKARVAGLENDNAVKAKDAEIAQLKEKITHLETAAREQVKVDAKAAIVAAVAEGKIPPQNADLQKHYEDLYIASPVSAKAILANLPKVTIQGAVIPNANGGAAAGAGGAAQGTEAEQFSTAVKAKAAELLSADKTLTPVAAKARALDLLVTTHPKLYASWREANGKPGLN